MKMKNDMSETDAAYCELIFEPASGNNICTVLCNEQTSFKVMFVKLVTTI